MKSPKNNKATDKGCCEHCCSEYHTHNNGGFTIKSCPCECHQAPTPSLSEGEEWIEKYRQMFGGQKWVYATEETMEDFIRQTLSNERERMVAIGEELKESGIRCRDREWECDSYNAATSAYQQKIKSLNS